MNIYQQGQQSSNAGTSSTFSKGMSFRPCFLMMDIQVSLWCGMNCVRGIRRLGPTSKPNQAASTGHSCTLVQNHGTQNYILHLGLDVALLVQKQIVQGTRLHESALCLHHSKGRIGNHRHGPLVVALHHSIRNKHHAAKLCIMQYADSNLEARRLRHGSRARQRVAI